MTKSDLIKILNNPTLLGNEHVVELEDLVNDYPFFQAARVLHLQGLNNQNSFRFNQILKTTALYTFDRSVLYELFADNLLKEQTSLNEEEINQLLAYESTTSEVDFEKEYATNLQETEFPETDTISENTEYTVEETSERDIELEEALSQKLESVENGDFEIKSESIEHFVEEKFELPDLDKPSVKESDEEDFMKYTEPVKSEYDLPDLDDKFADETTEEDFIQFADTVKPEFALPDLDQPSGKIEEEDFIQYVETTKPEVELPDLNQPSGDVEEEDFIQFTDTVKPEVALPDLDQPSGEMEKEDFFRFTETKKQALDLPELGQTLEDLEEEDFISNYQPKPDNKISELIEEKIESSEFESEYHSQEISDEIKIEKTIEDFLNKTPEIEEVESPEKDSDFDTISEITEEEHIFEETHFTEPQPEEVIESSYSNGENLVNEFELKESVSEEKDEEIVFELIPDEIFTQTTEKTTESVVIQESTPVTEEPTATESIPFTRQDAHYSFNDWLRIYSFKTANSLNKEQNQAPLEKKMEIIDDFITNNPKIEPVKNTKSIDNNFEQAFENEEIMTETLARVYVLQHKYTDAIRAYEILSLKFPEKSSFFASQIKQIENLRKNNIN